MGITMARERKTVTHQEFQQYLEDLASATPESKLALLASYAELQFRLHGGARCGHCRAHVRHVLAVTSQREDGSVQQYSCLCFRCLQAEKKVSRRLTLRAGKTEVEIKS